MSSCFNRFVVVVVFVVAVFVVVVFVVVVVASKHKKIR